MLQDFDCCPDSFSFIVLCCCRYSLRSLEQFTPWVRHIYIVTNGQVPFMSNKQFSTMLVFLSSSTSSCVNPCICACASNLVVSAND